MDKYSALRKMYVLIIAICLGNHLFAQQFKLQYSSMLSDKNFTGRVFIFLSKDNSNPLSHNNWTRLQPVFAIEVVGLPPNKVISINENNVIGFPTTPKNLERGEYYATTVFDNNMGGREIANSAGNYVSHTQKIMLSQNRNAIFHFIADSILTEPIFKTGKFRKEFKIKSDLLTAFHKKEIFITGGISLPDVFFKDPNRKLPLMINIEGFGGDYKAMGNYDRPMDTTWTGMPFIYVEIDGNCPTGHNVYANSANNGPYGDALVNEFLPQLEKQFNCDGFRYVTGHSSGGWAALWLKLNYPDRFNFCWSSSPDYLDYTAFQYVNIYKAKNFYYDNAGALTSYATVAGYWQVLSNKEKSQSENVLYRGEQLGSFEAVFSPKGNDGFPKKLWNRSTGSIDTSVANYWKNYDVNLFLKNNYDQIKANVDSQVIISVGYQDNFGLNVPVESLKELVDKKKMAIELFFVAGDHFTMEMSALEEKIFPRLRKQYQLFTQKK